MENNLNYIEILGWDAWAEKYKPIDNPLRKDSKQFETYGEELEYVKNANPLHVWTWVDGDMSDLIINGFALVNRFVYYVTEVPFEENDYITVILSTEEECECWSEENGEGDPECNVCEGYGLVTRYVDEEHPAW